MKIHFKLHQRNKFRRTATHISNLIRKQGYPTRIVKVKPDAEGRKWALYKATRKGKVFTNAQLKDQARLMKLGEKWHNKSDEAVARGWRDVGSSYYSRGSGYVRRARNMLPLGYKR